MRRLESRNYGLKKKSGRWKDAWMIPEGWVRTLRPCMGCSSSVTYIDKDKTWHCLKCGWSCSVNDTHVSASIENTADSGKGK